MSRVIKLKNHPSIILANIRTMLRNNEHRVKDGWPPGLVDCVNENILLACEEIMDELYTEDDFNKDLGIT